MTDSTPRRPRLPLFPLAVLLAGLCAVWNLAAASPPLLPVRLTVFDRIARPDEAVVVQAKLEQGGNLGVHPDMHGYPVWFTTPSGATRQARSGDDGLAPFPIALAAEAPSPCVVKAVFRGSDHHKPAEACGRVFVWPADSRILVTDVDHTISDLSEFKVPFTANKDIPPFPGAVAALSELAKTYRIVYLSAHHEGLYSKTQAWLREKGFPDGPLFCRHSIAGKQESFKRRFLADLKKRYPAVSVGVGDKPGDARAYLDNGMTAFLIRPKPGSKVPADAVLVASWQDVCAVLGKELTRKKDE